MQMHQMDNQVHVPRLMARSDPLSSLAFVSLLDWVAMRVPEARIARQLLAWGDLLVQPVGRFFEWSDAVRGTLPYTNHGNDKENKSGDLEKISTRCAMRNGRDC